MTESDKKEALQVSAQEHSPGEKNQTNNGQLRESGKQGRIVLGVLLVVAAVVFFTMVRIFIVPMIVAATFAALFSPLYRWLQKRLWNSRAAGALACCGICVFGVLIPTYTAGFFIVKQTVEFYGSADPKTRDLLNNLNQSITRRLSPRQQEKIASINWEATVQEGIKMVTKIGTIIVNKTSTSIFGLVFNIIIIIFVMFYLFIDGESITNYIRYLLPLRPQYTDMIFNRFLLVSRATVKGTIVIGLMQGTMGALILLVFGIQSWMVWGFVMILLSILPLVGSWIILVPAGIIQIAMGNVWQGITIIAFSIVVVSNLDNLIRPRLVGRDAKMHDLMIFFSTVGGIATFGIMGFIVGPVIAASCLAIVEIYCIEFREELEKQGADNFQLKRLTG